MADNSSPSLQPPRGMRDFYPSDMAVQRAIFDAWRTSAEQHRFLQYDACVVESLDLLKRKGGDEIVEQIYAFQDKSGRDLALRPEMTPSLARMVAARQGALPFPLKWFAIAQCFRYERTTRGRKREHYQWNLDVIGESAITAEAEVIVTAVNALSLLGLGHQDYVVLVNSRALLADLLLNRGIPSQHHQAVFLALDKREKLGDEKIADLLKESGMNAKDIASAIDLTRISSLDEVRQLLSPETESLAQLDTLLEMLAGHGVARFDISVVRGLGYYTGIVFEAFDVSRKFRAIFGGGRYDDLLAEVGGKPMTGVGLGFGDVVVAELLTELQRGPSSSTRTGIAIGYMDAAQLPVASALAASFRKQGLPADLALRPQKAKALFSHADRSDCSEAVFVGPDDIERGAVRIKNLEDGTEREEPIAGT